MIELRGIRKTFGPLVANDEVHLRVETGTIHAIVGENGAGKSTAMKVLYGQYSPDSGEILVHGKSRRWKNSADAIAAGFGMVHQHFMLAACHNAVENVLLCAGGSSFGMLNYAQARSRLERLMQEFKMEARLDVPVEKLSVGEQQRVEILKLLYRDSDFLILDEPTAVLAPGEIDSLFATLRGMAAHGKTILIITHKLKEVIALASTVTVFRAGKVTGSRPVKGATVAELAHLMVGREVGFVEPTARNSPRSESVLELRAVRPVRALERLEPVSFRLRAGEILGVAGVEGNGQSELIRLILDPRSYLQSGQIHLNGRDVSRCSAGTLREEAGLAVFPEDRLREALLLGASVEDNYLLGHHRSSRFRFGKIFLDRVALRQEVLEAIREYDVRPQNPLAIAASLSGGNQQKLVVARELSSKPKFLLAAQPTRGVDIGAIESIHARILALRNSGGGVLLISSELDETLKLSDRLLVLYRGRVVGSFQRSEFDEKRIGLLMAGGGNE
jgi:simple sugar transport system ATP-binding protein